MKRVSVDSIEEGMVLAEEVRGRSGNVLLVKGTPLSAGMGRRLKNWEIPFVCIEGQDDPQRESSPAVVSPQEVRERLERKFSGLLHDPIMKQIFAAVYQHRLRRGT